MQNNPLEPLRKSQMYLTSSRICCILLSCAVLYYAEI
nr:MAG TPA: hypothetical protein [Caudoviricetes sp.]